MYNKIIRWVLVSLTFIAVNAHAAPVNSSKAAKALRGWVRSGSTKMGLDLKKKKIADTQTYYNDAGDAIFYVVSFIHGGYAVLSADDQIEPIIAFSDEGSFSTDPENPLFMMLNADLSDRNANCEFVDGQEFSGNASKAKGKNKSKRMKRKQARWDRFLEEESVEMAEISTEEGTGSIDDVRVDELVSTSWNQSSPEDHYTPGSGPCGCVATAMAQLMKYHEHTYAVGLHSGKIKVEGVEESATTRGGDGAGGAYVWSAMPNNPGSSDYQVGALCYDAGVSVGMNYKSTAGSSYTERAAGAFTGWFGYDSGKKFTTSGSASQTQIETMINANLDALYPVLLGVYGSGGHAIVCDGYGFDSGSRYHHLNMGWGGGADAWYNLPTIDTSIFYSNYDRVYKIVYNAFPTGAGAIISGRVLDHNGNPLSGITVEGTSGTQTYTGTTNSKGIYALVHVPQGTCSVRVDDDDYTSETMSVTVGSTTTVDWCPNHWGIDLAVSDTILTADADAYVLSSSASANFGTAPELSVQDAGTAYESFIKFDLSGITETVQTAQLRLTTEENGMGSINEVYVMSNDSWTESGITYNNRPTAGQMVYELTPAFVPAPGDTTLLIGGAQNNGNLDDDSVVTDLSGNTWYHKEADLKYYISSESDGSGYYSGWTLSRSGSYPGGNNVIGMLTYAHPTMYDGGTSPDFAAFANTGGVQIQSDPVAATLVSGQTLTASFKASTHSSTATIGGTAVFIFDEGLSGESTVTATPSISTPFSLVTFNGSDTSYMGAFTATCIVPGNFSTVSLQVGVRNSTASAPCSLDDVELTMSPSGANGSELMLCIDVGPSVVSELAGDDVITFCLRGDSGFASYCSRETDTPPQLVLSGNAEADTAGDWENDSAQPDGQWTYGTYGVGEAYTTFEPYTVKTAYYGGSQSWIGGNGDIWDWSEGYPRVGKYATAPFGGTAHPTLEKMESVKRWTSNIKGVVTAHVGVQQIQDSADGDIITVRKNGVDLWSQNLNSSYRASEVLEIAVYPGDVIDFAVDPVGNGNADWCYLRARITTKTPTANRAGIKAHYDFDEASDMPTDADGDQYDRKMYAYDFSGNSQFATLKNCDTWTVWQAGTIGNAIDLDGVNDYVATPVALNPGINQCSASAWIKGGAANDVILSQRNGQNWLKLNAAGQFATGILPSGGSDLAAATAWDAAAWHHVVMTWDGARRRLYIDGAEVAADAVDLATPVSETGVLNIGTDASLSNYFDGMLDDLGIWSRDLSSSEVYAMYKSGLAGRNLGFAKSYPRTVVDLSQTKYNYDLGPANSVVFSDWTLISPETEGDIYWNTTVGSRDRGAGGGVNDANRDLLQSSLPAILQHRVANGTWKATLNMGDKNFPHDDMQVTMEGSVESGLISNAANEFPYAFVTAFVDDGYVTLEFADMGGSDVNWVATRLSLANMTNDNLAVASAVSASVVGGSSVGITLNGSDADGDTLTYTLSSQPTHGTLTGTGSNLTYTADRDYSGPDSFTYTVADDFFDSAPATVSITVAANTDYDNDGLPNDWENQYFSSSTVAAPNGNPDGDALENLAEYAFGGNPTNAALVGTLPRVEKGSADMECIFDMRDDPNLTATILISPDCASGNWVTNGSISGASGTGFTSFTNSLPNVDCLFIKLRIEK